MVHHPPTPYCAACPDIYVNQKAVEDKPPTGTHELSWKVKLMTETTTCFLPADPGLFLAEALTILYWFPYLRVQGSPPERA